MLDATDNLGGLSHAHSIPIQALAVIGAGPMGLAAIKDLTEDGFDVTGYEARSHVGGLWKYSTDSSISVAANTIFNTSKYRLAFSDFPPSDDMDDFPMADKVYEYIDAYADHFNLKPKVRLDSRVEQVRRAGHKWAVETKGGSTDYYDKVVISIGTFLEPKKPSLRGIDKFEGTVLHSKDFHDPAKYAGNRVLILGVHASAIDVATGLADYTSKIYMAHRHGLLILPRFSPDGRTFDQSQSLRMVIILNAFMTYFPALFGWFLDKALSSMSKKAYNIPESWGFSPAPSITRQTPVIGDEIYPLLNSGRVDPVLAVEQMIGPKTIELKDGRVLQDIDAIIYCTGYCSTLDILEEKYITRLLHSQGRHFRGPWTSTVCQSSGGSSIVRSQLTYQQRGHLVAPMPDCHEAIAYTMSTAVSGATDSYGHYVRKFRQACLRSLSTSYFRTETQIDLTVEMSKHHIEKVAIVGAGGNSGKYIAEALLKTGKHTVTAISRAESSAKLPEDRSEWKVAKEPSKERYTTALEKLKQGGGQQEFVKVLYTRVFYPDDSGNFAKTKGLHNDLLGLPTEDIDEATKAAIQRAKELGQAGSRFVSLSSNSTLWMPPNFIFSLCGNTQLFVSKWELFQLGCVAQPMDVVGYLSEPLFFRCRICEVQKNSADSCGRPVVALSSKGSFDAPTGLPVLPMQCIQG
ncbi:hypothetical protein M8818_001144 [Zalaria obscura]|uniref:Uncharacterized protein n=1 Tax=Zalaria obscura TaxID=2024903 RepID=A0ACC3SNH6_9PEZI